MKVILLSGKIGSGKDTVAGVLTRLLKERNYDVKLFAFADPLKYSVAYLRDKSRDLFYSRQGKDGSGHEDQEIRRQLLVAIGEAACEVDPFIFCRKTKAIMENQQVRGSKQIFIITDLRKETELNFAIDNFQQYIIRLKGSFEPTTNKKIANAPIETELDYLDDTEPNYYIGTNQHFVSNDLSVINLKDVREGKVAPEDIEPNKRYNIQLLDHILDVAIENF